MAKKKDENISANIRKYDLDIPKIAHGLTETKILVSRIRILLWVWMFV